MTTNPDGATPGPRAATSPRALLHISDLLSYRLSRLANLMSGSAALRYRREFDVSLAEWRTLALIGEDPSLTLNRLARRAGLDKAQMSRVVAKLTERGLLSRELGPGRTTQLSLTRKCRGLSRTDRRCQRARRGVPRVPHRRGVRRARIRPAQARLPRSCHATLGGIAPNWENTFRERSAC